MYTDKKYVTVSDVINMDREDAIKTLKDLKVEFVGNGDKVIYQSPEAGMRIYEGETVRLFTS